MILVDAVYINNSGGLTLLKYFIQKLSKKKIKIHYLLDKRVIDLIEIDKSRVTFISNSILRRHLFYVKKRSIFSQVFCFGNLPPTLKLKAKVYTYFHNVLFFDKPINYPVRLRISKYFKSKVLQFLAKNTNEFWVQSQSVKELLSSNINDKTILVLPFYNSETKQIFPRLENASRKINFCYISNGNAHKNHEILLKAWKLINKTQPKYKLHLTVTETFPQILKLISIYKNEGVNILNHGWTDTQSLFETCRLQIYPSLNESFGLGLVESIESGCEVLAADLPYAHEVIEAASWFDPSDHESIAESVLNLQLSGEILMSKIKVKNEIDQIIKRLLD